MFGAACLGLRPRPWRSRGIPEVGRSLKVDVLMSVFAAVAAGATAARSRTPPLLSLLPSSEAGYWTGRQAVLDSTTAAEEGRKGREAANYRPMERAPCSPGGGRGWRIAITELLFDCDF